MKDLHLKVHFQVGLRNASGPLQERLRFKLQDRFMTALGKRPRDGLKEDSGKTHVGYSGLSHALTERALAVFASRSVAGGHRFILVPL